MRAWKRLKLNSAEVLFNFLVMRATTRAMHLGHIVSPWSNAKRKMGKGAFKATCTKCGLVVFIMPHGQHGLPKIGRDAPALTGEALVTSCK